ncbi:tolloid-like protein 1 [Artemia franciscana]|uniref:tolloid-like protein 1 n=1 Tax=Artemia franciscana TaxID=6661 RepID=UPI0032DB3D10
MLKALTFYIFCASLTNGKVIFKSVNPRDECGSVLSGNEGNFTSPGYPDLYPSNVTCEYIISTSNADRGIRLTFSDFSTELDNDYVEVRDGNSSTAPLLERITGEPDISTLSATSTSSNMYVALVTDSSVRGRGFSAAYASICPNLLTDDKGGFSSPNFPSPYNPDANLCWGISVQPGFAIELEVTSFVTSPEDVMTIYDGASEDSPIITSLSGEVIGDYYSTGNNMYITFISNPANELEGFVVYYKQVCGNRFVDPSGTVSSPGYPSPYPQNANECYFISVTAGKTVQITFTDFVTEPNYDVLRIYDGPTAESPLLASLSGGETGTVVTSTSSKVYMVFTSDADTGGAGFTAEYVEV